MEGWTHDVQMLIGRQATQGVIIPSSQREAGLKRQFFVRYDLRLVLSLSRNLYGGGSALFGYVLSNIMEVKVKESTT